MPKPIQLKKILKTLKDRGFVLISQRGSHAKFRSVGKPKRTVIVKMSSNEIPYGTFKSILEQSGLEEEDFLQG